MHNNSGPGNELHHNEAGSQMPNCMIWGIMYGVYRTELFPKSSQYQLLTCYDQLHHRFCNF
jgi:hypothetical protein